MLGPSASRSAPGSLISMVYTESADADFGVGDVVAFILALAGKERLSLAAGGGAGDGGSKDLRRGEVPSAPAELPEPPREAYGSLITLSDVHLRFGTNTFINSKLLSLISNPKYYIKVQISKFS